MFPFTTTTTNLDFYLHFFFANLHEANWDPSEHKRGDARFLRWRVFGFHRKMEMSCCTTPTDSSASCEVLVKHSVDSSSTTKHHKHVSFRSRESPSLGVCVCVVPHDVLKYYWPLRSTHTHLNKTISFIRSVQMK